MTLSWPPSCARAPAAHATAMASEIVRRMRMIGSPPSDAAMLATHPGARRVPRLGQTRWVCTCRARSAVHNRPMSFDLVLFGGTGDLTWRKLMPALFQAFRHGKLPENGRILAVARDEMPDERYREWLQERFREVEEGKRPTDEEFERFASLVHYRRMDLSQPDHYSR